MSDLAEILRDDKGHKYGGLELGYFDKTFFLGSYEFFRGAIRRFFFKNQKNLNKIKNICPINNILVPALRISALYHPSKFQPNRTSGSRKTPGVRFRPGEPRFRPGGPDFCPGDKIFFFQTAILCVII